MVVKFSSKYKKDTLLIHYVQKCILNFSNLGVGDSDLSNSRGGGGWGHPDLTKSQRRGHLDLAGTKLEVIHFSPIMISERSFII